MMPEIHTMSSDLSVRVFDGHELQIAVECRGEFEIGRNEGSESPGLASDGGRLVIAGMKERGIARKQASVEPLADGRIRLNNLSTKVKIHLSHGAELAPGQSRDLPLPAVFKIGPKAVRVQTPDRDDDAELVGLAEATAPPSQSMEGLTRLLSWARSMEPKNFIGWLEAALSVLQSAAGSDEFFENAAQTAADVVELDSARVYLRDGDAWRPHPPAAGETPPSQTVLARVLGERRTFRGQPRDLAEAKSLAAVQAVVAAPILNAGGDVVGVLYGERRLSGKRPARPIEELEAKLVELLAGTVAAGLARLEEEQEAATARIRYEEFLTPELARHLLAQPGLLESREIEVTVLFADIRGYSGVCERLGAEASVSWVSDVLGELSDCVRAEGGVLVDYVGDELMAMWGAPAEQPDHAARACRAARDMLARLPALDARWRDKTCSPLEIGVGIHTGLAHVGNVGTKHKFKYGPLGPTNNLASRVQGATKFLRVPTLVTGATRGFLDNEFATRRLTRVKVVNINEPVDLVELHADPPPGWNELRDGYEAALADFEAGRTLDAIRRLGPLLAAHPDDGPSLLLLARAVQARQPHAPEFDPVWVLPGK
jgi:adenylate cyclase